MPEAIQFVQDHLEELKSKPTAFFFGCLMATNPKKHGQWIDKFLDPARALVKPVAEGAFAGSYWPEKYPNFQTRFGLWVFTRYIGIAKGDYRDWNAISAWAESIRPLIIV
jgi:menaquinone-dependent protoporphyrinogen IX oxidase